MKIETQPGKFYHKALFREHWIDRNERSHFNPMWNLTPGYFDSREAVIEYIGHGEVLWPADCIADGVIYVPTEEELL